MPAPAWLVALAVSVVLNVASILLTPKAKGPRPEAARELTEPTAEAGKPIPVLFGRKLIRELNVLWYGDKSVRTYKVKV